MRLSCRITRFQRAFAWVLNRQSRHDYQHFLHAIVFFCRQQHSADFRVNGQPCHLFAELGQLILLIDGTQLQQHLKTIVDITLIRRFKKWKRGHIAQLQRGHAQNHRRQIAADDFGVGKRGALVKVFFRIQTHGHTSRYTTASTGTLACRRLRDFFHMQLFDFGTRGIAFHPRQTGIDDIFNARHGERSFGHVGRQHNAAFVARWVKNFVLLSIGQTRKQRQDFVIAAQRRFAQGFSGLADFAFARQKHQNIAFAITRQFISGIDNGIGQLDFGFVFIDLMQRAIQDFHRKSAAAHFQHRRAAEMLGKTLGINRGRGDDDFQIRAAR